MIMSIIKKIINKILIERNKGYVTKVADDILGETPFVAVDVGAAVGIQSWWFEVLEFATIYAFEPNK